MSTLPTPARLPGSLSWGGAGDARVTVPRPRPHDAALGRPRPAPDFDALSEALSEAVDQHLRSLNGRAAAHWLFAASMDLAGRLIRRDLTGAAAALESAHQALLFANTRASDAPALWRALADIACALQRQPV